MEVKHKEILGTFRRTTKFKNNDGKSESLDTIIHRYRVCGYEVKQDGCDMRDLISEIHPYLFMNYVIDWQSIPDTRVPKGFNTGIEFGREVIKQWRAYCWKNKMWNFDIFKIFKNPDELSMAIDIALDGSLYYKGGDYMELCFKITEAKQAAIEKEEENKKREKERLELEREAALAENKAKEAARIADELRRKQLAEDNEKTAQFYKDMQARPNSPYSRDDQEPTDTNPFRFTEPVHLSAPCASSPFELTPESFLSAPVPEPNSRQLILKKNASGEFEFAHGAKIPKKGVITPRNIGGTLYMCWERTGGITSSNATHSLWSYYNAKSYIAFTLRDNVSQNPDITALPITSISVDGKKI